MPARNRSRVPRRRRAGTTSPRRHAAARELPGCRRCRTPPAPPPPRPSPPALAGSPPPPRPPPGPAAVAVLDLRRPAAPRVARGAAGACRRPVDADTAKPPLQARHRVLALHVGHPRLAFDLLPADAEGVALPADAEGADAGG